jgi:hypothetical protein
MAGLAKPGHDRFVAGEIVAEPHREPSRYPSIVGRGSLRPASVLFMNVEDRR